MNKMLRAPLTQEQKDKCHELLDEIIKLHDETTPSEGKKSEFNKCEKAFLSLNKFGELSSNLCRWAELQVGRGQILISRGKANDFDAINTHSNEMLPSPDITASEFREVIARILTAYSKNNAIDWKTYLAGCLYCLNEGQVKDLLEPPKKSGKKKLADLRLLKWAAICHVYKEWGESKYGKRGKKDTAQRDVAKACNVGIDAIKLWEKEFRSESDVMAEEFILIKKAAQIRQDINHLHSVENCDTESLIETVKSAYNQKPSLDGYENLVKGLERLSWQEKTFPLEFMGQRLIEAGCPQRGNKKQHIVNKKKK